VNPNIAGSIAMGLLACPSPNVTSTNTQTTEN